ncbi:hypothetical protein BHF71_07180 [Vulcanibacillus modesticaldus]|uniref:Nitroreductase domain-containing protein n=1 Tax=Vulcanibacillus modesticaldus TaxID=337097 RepID=A0A1D2YWF0_9BACI|nr:nitroreductase family protein [Vulcanibacillus modesticaldus]OEF99977.1 hypothetical protein BHF71_07180 [Vulcanibacillus modesticaldus]
MLELLKKRRSIRKFKKDKVPNDLINQIIQAALLSPSSRKINPWEFIVVDDENYLEKLSHSKIHGSHFLKNAPLGIVVVADENKSDVWIEDTSISSIIIQLTAHSLGLGSCWIQIRNRMNSENQTAEDYIKNLLAIPDNYKVESIIAIGYPDENKPPHTEKELQFEKVHLNKFNKPFFSTSDEQ